MGRQKTGYRGPVLLGVAAALFAVAAHKGYINLPDLPSAAADTSSYARPADGPVTSGFGARWGSFHYGIDIGAPYGAPIRAVADGTIIEAGPASGFGNWVREQLPDGTILVYGHMKYYRVRAGERVAAGERIASVGAEGQATGPHLHLEVWPRGSRAARIDPAPWLADRGVSLT